MAERPIGKWERLCIEREERERELARTGHPKGFYFDEKAARFAVKWIEKHCRHFEGEWKGRRMKLEPWQVDRMIAPVFGWRKADGSRRYRKAWWEMPRKNGKTQIGAAVGTLLLVGDNEPGAQVYMTATVKDQAAICHVAARNMILQSPELSQAVKVPKKLHGNLVCDRLGSKMEILSSEAETKDGLSPHGDIRDEVHEWKDHALAGKLTTAMGARRQPLTVEITTAGIYDAESVGWQHHEYATNILEGLFEDDRQQIYITAIDEEDDPWDPSTWAKANPNLGVSLKRDFIEGEATTARSSPLLANDFLRYNLNRWVQQATRWLDVDKWRQLDGTPIDLGALRGLPWYVGIDLSKTTDLTAVVIFWVLPNKSIAVLPRFWIPQGKLEVERKKLGQSRFNSWCEKGLIVATPGNVVDYGFVREYVIEASKAYPNLREIGFDPWNAPQLQTELQAAGLPVVEVRQGVQTLSAASKWLEGAILDKQVLHGGNPVATWMIGNAVARQDANRNIMPDKQRSKDKIDFVSALVTGLSRWVVAKQESGPSVYESRGFLRL